jgi:hypothetical protein
MILNKGSTGHSVAEQHLLEVMQAPFKKGGFVRLLQQYEQMFVVVRGPQVPSKAEIFSAWDRISVKLRDPSVHLNMVLCESIGVLFSTILCVKTRKTSRQTYQVKTWADLAKEANAFLDDHPDEEEYLPPLQVSHEVAAAADDLLKSLSY